MAHLRAAGGRGRRGRGSGLPALTTAIRAAASRSHTGRALHQRGDTARTGEAIDRHKHQRSRRASTPTFQRGVPEALGARRSGGEGVRPHVGGRDGGRPVPGGQLRLRLRREADGSLSGFLNNS